MTVQLANWGLLICLVICFIGFITFRNNQKKSKKEEARMIALLTEQETIYRERYGDKAAKLIMKGEWEALEEILGKKIPH